MSLQDLSLPIDIPWKLVATSNDMLATHTNRFPNAMWKSSLAIFAYDPDLSDLPDEFSDRELTFLKVVASITSYAPTCADMPPPPDPTTYGEEYAAYEADYAAWQQTVSALKQIEQQTYPCSGALVQVAIYPKQDDTTDVAKLAHFTSMEPQKRELIEAVTESGESMTQSKTDLGVRKGVTTTDTTEEMNLFTGLNVSGGGGSASGAKGEGSTGISGQWGTIKKGTVENVDTTTTDTSREKRENSSHTTNLSQLYHLLNSYHLGTNRAIFFLQPRPHTVQQKERFTFIAGPQEIEGIQEFFLVVSRPKGIGLDQYCVDALLYTAHLDTESMRTAILEPKTAETPWLDLWGTARHMPSTTDDTFRSIGTVWVDSTDVSSAVNLANFTPQGPQTIAAWDAAFKNGMAVQTGDASSKGLIAGRLQLDQDTLPLNSPAIVDQTITTGVLRKTVDPSRPPSAPEPGWRIDRTRGLGGYDLWEDPTNVTADPRSIKTSVKPQATIDILSNGSPNDPDYLPDCALRVRALAWAQGADQEAMYHARIKVYFIRDDTPTDGRQIPMFVTARGVSTCADSPFAQYYASSADPSKLPADIAGEATITPVNVAPWLNIPPESPQILPPLPSDQSGNNSSPQSATREVPLNSSRPSGLNPFAVGAARVKMANAIANDVRYKLKTMLTCPQVMFIPFRYSDFVFQTVARQRLTQEISRLAAVTEKHPDLAQFVATHPAAGRLPVQVAAPTRPVAAPHLPAASKAFPALTLRELPASERGSFHKAGVRTALDLVDVPLTDLARRLGVDATNAARKRLKALGVNLQG